MDHYKELANSEEPFICLYCSNVQLKRVVDKLTATVLSLKEDLKEALTFREHLSSITSEVSALKQSLTTQPSSLTATHRRKPQTYAAVVRPPRPGKSEQPAGKSAAKHSSSNNMHKRPVETNGKTKVEGARRI